MALPAYKLRVMLKAIKLRLNNGEYLEAILASWPNLTQDDIAQILEELNKIN